MSSITPTFSGETQFAGFADSSKSGPRITLRLADRESLEAFIGAEGQRFACVLVRIGDDEQAVPPPAAKPAKPKGSPDHALSKWSALRCADPEFWRWIELMDGLRHGAIDNAGVAAEWVRMRCEVKSRAEFDADPAAAHRFRSRVIGPWNKHCIARGITS